MFKFKYNFQYLFFVVFCTSVSLKCVDQQVQTLTPAPSTEQQAEVKQSEKDKSDDFVSKMIEKLRSDRQEQQKDKRINLSDLALVGSGAVLGGVLGALAVSATSGSSNNGRGRHRNAANYSIKYYHDRFRRDSLFQMLTGVNEATFAEDLEKYIQLKTNGFYELIGPDRKYRCGKINLDKVSDLRGSIDSHFSSAAGRGSFNIVYLHGGNEAPLRCFADIAALQAHPANKGSTFQLASRLNAVEHFCVHQNRFDAGVKPGWYAGDASELRPSPFSENYGGVQGEEGAFSAAPGGILRMYGDITIDLLQHVDPTCKLFHPFCPVIPGGRAIDANKDLFQGSWTDNLLICFHEGIEVVSGLEDYQNDNRRFNYSFKVRRGQIINQVPVSAFNFHWDNEGNSVSPFAENVAKQLLKASYQGTLMSAIVHGKADQKIFLTMVGGGVFYNKLEWIAEAIASCEPLIRDFHLKVYLVVWGGGDFENWNKRGGQPLYEMVPRFGGRTIILDNYTFSVVPEIGRPGRLIDVKDQGSFDSAGVVFNQFLRGEL